MSETSKQVRVDNWGIFFLQRLQLFFNRTDYCDLTLQFEGNVQLKVHRLVMNACTEYFNILEQMCEVIDGNTIIMPDDLQADVILPIVNFMYTGMLEYQTSIFDKLYRTADIMNIPILTKLLDAQKKPIHQINRSNKKTSSTWNSQTRKGATRADNDSPSTISSRKQSAWKRKSTPIPSPATTTGLYSEPRKPLPDPLALIDNTPRPTRFEWPEDDINSTFNLMESTFDDISYTSKPLITQDDELRASTSFEESTKYGTPISRRTKEYSQIDMDEVKNYIKEQKKRSDMIEYDDEDDPDYLDPVSVDSNKRKSVSPVSPVHTKKVRFSMNEKENKETKLNITTVGRTQDVDHTKIISEVLKKYPHLVKKNKNIRLKILAKSPTKSESSKTNQNSKMTSKIKVQVSSPKASPRMANSPTNVATKMGTAQDEGPWVCHKCTSNDEPVEFVLYYLYRKHMTDVHHEKFDSKMCKFCGHQSNKQNVLMYHQLTKHGLKPPPAYNFPRCNRCPYVALTENLLAKHKLNHTKSHLQCSECKIAFNNRTSLSSHIQITGHTGKSGRHNYDCQYCTQRHPTLNNLFSHIKLAHHEEARRDGIVSIDEKDDIEEEASEDENEEYLISTLDENQKDKIKILSDIKVASTSGVSANQVVQQTQSRIDSNSITDVQEGIATSLGLVDVVVLDENQQYILHDDQQLVTQETLINDQQEYIIPDMSDQHTFTQGQNINEVITSEHNVIAQSILNNSDIASTDELVMVLTDHDYNDGNNEILSNENSNIVVLYSHPVDGQQNQFITSQGNLMLNSQTGLLEIRNSDSMDNSQDTQIESIEMIQREINSHNIISTAHAEDTIVSTSSAFEQSLSQNTVVLAGQYSSKTCVVESKQMEEVQTTENVVVTQKGEELSQHVLILNDCLDAEQEQPMEIDEECNVQDNQGENQNILEETESAQMENNITIEENTENTISKSMPDIDGVTETFDHTMETEPSINPIQADVQVDAVQIDRVITAAEDTNAVNTALECTENEITQLQTESETHIQNAEAIVEDQVVESEIPISNEFNECNETEMIEPNVENAVHEEVSEQLIQIETQNGGGNIEYVTDAIDQAKEVELTQQGDVSDSIGVADAVTEVSEQITQQVEEIVQNVEELVQSEEINQNNQTTELEHQLSYGTCEIEHNDIGDPQILQSQEGEVQAQIEDINLEADMGSLQPIETPEQVEENSVQNELTGETLTDDKVNLEEQIEEDASSLGENSQSQDSQTSHCSSKQEEISVGLKKNTSQETKMSILNDWEDTEDSQQSDQTSKKDEITVTKLMHDWDDDEEEGKNLI